MRRGAPITWFVIGWLLLFSYATLRANFLGPALHLDLPKVPLLFPPAGWIMFYNIDNTYGSAEVHAIRDGQTIQLDPHDIFETRAVGYDNIRRNVMVGTLYSDRATSFCHYLKRKFPAYRAFAVVYRQYPDLVNAPDQSRRQVMYRCR